MMKVKFWGTRGSLPSTFTLEHLQNYLKQGISYAMDSKTGIKKGQSIDEYIESMPEHLKYTCGVNTSCITIETGTENEYIICDAGTGLRDLGVDYAKRCVGKTSNVSLVFNPLALGSYSGISIFCSCLCPRQ